MENLDSTVLSTSLPAIALDLHEDPVSLKLALTSYLLSLADLLPENTLDFKLGSAHRRETDMKRSRFSEEQIIGILKEHQAGLTAAEICRRYGISDATFYNWRSKYGGMEISEAKRLKALEDENRKLKKLLAELMLDVATLKELLGKNF